MINTKYLTANIIYFDLLIYSACLICVICLWPKGFIPQLVEQLSDSMHLILLVVELDVLGNIVREIMVSVCARVDLEYDQQNTDY